MHRLTTLLMLFSLLTATGLFGGCAVYDVAVEERNVGDWAGDEKIGLTIEKDFLADATVKYLDFDAACYEGHVYITGEYESHDQVTRAVEIAKAVKGVRQVTTYLLPKKENDDCSTTDSLDIHTRLWNKLMTDKEIWSTNINVETVQCNVILLGIVGTQTAKDRAEAHAKAIPGVRSVKSYLKVNK